MGQETPTATTEVIQRLELNSDIEQRFRQLFRDIFYKTAAITCITFGREHAYENASGKVYLTGSTNYALRVHPDILPIQLFDQSGRLTEVQRPDADMIIDLGVEHAEELAHALTKSLTAEMPKGTDIAIEVKTDIYMPRLDIIIDGRRVGEVLLLKSCADREKHFRNRLGEQHYISKNNLHTHLAAQTVKQEACAAELVESNGRINVVELWGIESTNPTVREDNPASIYRREKILRLIDVAESEDELVMLDAMNNYIRVHFYRSLVKISEIGQFFGDYPFLKSDIDHRLTARARALSNGDFNEAAFLEKIIPEEKHFRQKIARYIVRAILSAPRETLALLAEYPYLEPFTNMKLGGTGAPELLMRYGWTSGLSLNLADHEGYPSKTEVDQALGLAGYLVERIKPTSFKEVIAILAATTGEYEQDALTSLIDSVAWPRPSDYMTVDERWGVAFAQHFEAGLSDEDKEQAKSLALEIVRRIHPTPLFETPSQNFYVQGLSAHESPRIIYLLRIIDKTYYWGSYIRKYSPGTPVQIPPQNLFIYLLTVNSLVSLKIGEIAEDIILDSRTI